MRIGSTSPRINGRLQGRLQGLGAQYSTPPVQPSSPVSYVDSKVGGTPGLVQRVATVTSFMEEILRNATSSQFYLVGDVRPENCYGLWLGNIQHYCLQFPDACAGVDQAGLASELCAKFSQWYATALADYYQQQESTGSAVMDGIPPPPNGYQPPTVFTSGPGYVAQQAGATPEQALQISENALDRTTPVQTQVVQAPVSNVLSPPQASQPMSTVTQNTGTTALTNPKTSDPLAATAWIEDNWALLAAGAGALFLLTMMGSKR